jgi:hypothetical protein
MRLTAIDPTIFFIRVADGLRQGVDVTVTHDGAPASAAILVAGGVQEVRYELGALPAGDHTRRLYIPDLREPASLDFVLLADGEARDRRTVYWQPQRHWEVYVVHNSHHDLGCTDLPSNVLREHDCFLDEVIDFCAQTTDWPEESRFRFDKELQREWVDIQAPHGFNQVVARWPLPRDQHQHRRLGPWPGFRLRRDDARRVRRGGRASGGVSAGGEEISVIEERT